jgi:hypothetical protein
MNGRVAFEVAARVWSKDEEMGRRKSPTRQLALVSVRVKAGVRVRVLKC